MSLPRDIDRRRNSIARIKNPPWAVSPISALPRYPLLASLESNKSPSPDSKYSSVEPEDRFSSLQKHLRPDTDPFGTEGADVTRDIYKFTLERPQMKRSKSLSLSETPSERRGLQASALNVPGGFRRQFVWAQNPRQVKPSIFTRNFIEFLSIYGHFAGEDLEDDYDIACHYARGMGEETALLDLNSGTASDVKAYFLLVKAFVGTGVLFLPRAFASGGLAFSAILLFTFGILLYWCYLALVYAKIAVCVSGFAELGRILYGPRFLQLIVFSIILSQVGFVAAYIVFTAENLRAFVVALLGGAARNIDISWFVLGEACILTPLALIRDITRLSLSALLANVFIMIGLVTIVCYTALEFAANEWVAGPNVHFWFNSSEFTLFIGVAIFAFEGIGLIIPIQESMKNPDHFPRVLFMVVATISTIFVFIGGLGYLTFGENIETVIMLNLPQKSPLVIAIQILYALAILLSTPIQVFPAVRLIELRIFTSLGKTSHQVKWLKNAVRLAFILFTSLVALFGGRNLDKFVSFVGCFACIPLVYMYPPMLHLKSCCGKDSRYLELQLLACKVADYGMLVLGTVALVYSTYDLFW